MINITNTELQAQVDGINVRLGIAALTMSSAMSCAICIVDNRSDPGELFGRRGPLGSDVVVSRLLAQLAVWPFTGL